MDLRSSKTWFHEGCLKLLDQIKQDKLQCLQDSSKMNGNNLNNISDKDSSYFKNNKKEYLKVNINELATKIKTKSRGIN
jgi:hypothetical protein